jgi:hypothetical protein
MMIYSFIYLLSNWHEAHINMILGWSPFQKIPLLAELADLELADFSGSRVSLQFFVFS